MTTGVEPRIPSPDPGGTPARDIPLQFRRALTLHLPSRTGETSPWLAVRPALHLTDLKPLTAGPVEVPPTLGHKSGRLLSPRQSFTSPALASGRPCPIFAARGHKRVSGAFNTRPTELTAALAAQLAKRDR